MSPQTLGVANATTSTSSSAAATSSSSMSPPPPSSSSSPSSSSPLSTNLKTCTAATIIASSLSGSNRNSNRIGKSSSNCSGNSSSNSSIKSKQVSKQNSGVDSNIALTRNICMPTLQWRWNCTASASPSATSTGQYGSNGKKRNAAAAAATTSGAAQGHDIDSSNHSKKSRISTSSTTTSSATLSSSISFNNGQTSADNCTGGATISKRLKTTVRDETQTKITGYFKSQVKSQILDCNNKQTASSLASFNTAPDASLNKYFNILAKLKETQNDNLLGNNDKASKLNSSSSNSSTAAICCKVINATNTQSVSISNIIGANIPNGRNIATSDGNTIINGTSSMPMPGLKKIERSKPTKIAQVAPNLRKTTSTTTATTAAATAALLNTTNPNSVMMGLCATSNLGSTKSPLKKHVTIAPRTSDIKQQQSSQNQIVACNKQEYPKQQGIQQAIASLPPQNVVQNTFNSPAVLLTSIRFPSATQEIHTKYTTGQVAKLATSANPTNTTVVTTESSNNPTGGLTSLYQFPMQLPNLVQLPQLINANGTNIMQLNNVAAAVAKAASTGGTASTASTASAQAAAAQYFLNGTIFKLQQFTTATTTTATSAVGGAASSANNFSLLTTNDLHEIIIKQQRQQQYHPEQQHKAAAAAAAITTTNATANFQELFQQQMAAALAATQQQQHVHLQQLQQISNATNLPQPVFMATPTGLLLNAATLPTMLAQAAAAIAVNNQQQQKSITLPALQPIQQNSLPSLSSIFPVHLQPQQQHQQPDCDFHTQHQQAQVQAQAQAQVQPITQQQFIATIQQPCLSSVELSTINGSNVAFPNVLSQLQTIIQQQPQPTTAKLAIVKSNSTTGPLHTSLSSQPPPLVTISKSRSQNATFSTRTTTSITSTTTSSSMQVTAHKTSSSATSTVCSPYSKRNSKLKAGSVAVTAAGTTSPSVIATATATTTATAASTTTSGKLLTGGKIFATSTTPPPLVPTMPVASPQTDLGTISVTGSRTSSSSTPKKISMKNVPTPHLVSIASNPIYPKQTVNYSCGGVTMETVTAGGLSITSSSTSFTSSSSTCVSNEASNNISRKLISSSETVKTNKLNNTKDGKLEKSSRLTTSTSLSTASDLFDIIKASSNPKTLDSLQNKAFSSHKHFHGNTNATDKLQQRLTPSITTIKQEPISTNETDSKSSENLIYNANNNSSLIKDDLTSFSGQFICTRLNAKKEPSSNSTTTNTIPITQHLEQSTLHNNENSLSSFSSLSNTVSSAADLSLEVLTPALVPRSISTTPLSCSLLSQTGGSLTNQAIVYSNSDSTASSYVTGSLSQDMLCDMITSTSNSSDIPDLNVDNNKSNNMDKKLILKDKEDTCSDASKRDFLPSPESGIGGSLSTSESIDFSSKSSTMDILPSAASTCDTIKSPQLLIEDLFDSANKPATNSASNDRKTPPPASSSSLKSKVFSPNPNTSTPAPFIDTRLLEVASSTPKSAISPILSQPKIIRFPAESGYRCGPKGNKRHDGVCYWDRCNKKHDSNSKLLDHMQTHHVNTQIGPFACLWVGCKVYNKESCSRRWLERHVLSHGGSKQFKCIVEGCGLRFGSQLALQKHVNNHFTTTDSREGANKRTSDPPVPKQLRKNGKKLRYRRQPFSARMFDFFDAGIMEGLQHRLRQLNAIVNSDNSITFHGKCVMRRRRPGGTPECFIRWSPPEIISDEWLPESNEPYIKTVYIKNMKPDEKNNIENLLTTAYLLQYSFRLYNNCKNVEQTQQNATPDSDNDDSITTASDNADSADQSFDDVKNVSYRNEKSIFMSNIYHHLRNLTDIHTQKKYQKHSRKPKKSTTNR